MSPDARVSRRVKTIGRCEITRNEVSRKFYVLDPLGVEAGPFEHESTAVGFANIAEAIVPRVAP